MRTDKIPRVIAMVIHSVTKSDHYEISVHSNLAYFSLFEIFFRSR